MSHRKIIALAAVVLLALAGNAMATDVVYYTGDIWAGKTTDVGTITATMHYTTDDDATLEIQYATDAGWLMTECHLWIGTQAPVSRGAPGQYPYNSGTISKNSYSFSIPIADLISDFGIDWGSEVWVMPHCALTWEGSGDPPGGETRPTGYGGKIVKPKKGSWFGFFGFELTEPYKKPRELYGGTTLKCGDWQNFWYYERRPGFWTDADVEATLPVTLAGVRLETVRDLYDALKIAETPWDKFMVQLAALYCNTTRDGTLEDAYYDAPGTGEFMENRKISDIMLVANDYRPDTSEVTLGKMHDVCYAINYNTWSNLGVLWDGPKGRPVPLGQTARLTVSPNPFTGSTRIRLQNSLESEARVSVYDLSGKKVNELTCNQVWNGTDARGKKLAAGVYLLRLVSGTQSVSARAVVSR